MALTKRDVLAVLEGAYNLIGRREKWGTGSDAYDAEGNEVPADSKEAVKWCAGGAVIHEARRGRKRDIALSRLQKAVREIQGDPEVEIWMINDDEPDGYRRVRAAYRLAIRKLRAEISS